MVAKKREKEVTVTRGILVLAVVIIPNVPCGQNKKGGHDTELRTQHRTVRGAPEEQTEDSARLAQPPNEHVPNRRRYSSRWLHYETRGIPIEYPATLRSATNGGHSWPSPNR